MSNSLLKSRADVFCFVFILSLCKMHVNKNNQLCVSGFIPQSNLLLMVPFPSRCLVMLVSVPSIVLYGVMEE